MYKRFTAITVTLLACQVLGLPSLVRASSPGLLITEIKLGGGSEPKEFIEIFNDTAEPVSLSGFQFEYAKDTFQSSKCGLNSWKAAAEPASQVNTKALGGVIEPYNFEIVEISLNDNVSGSARLIYNDSTNFAQYDLVAWGSEAPCLSGAAAPIPLIGMSIKRTFDYTMRPIQSRENDSRQDFSLAEQPSPGSDECLEVDCHQPEPEEPDQEEPPEGHFDIQITELLPDPASPKLDNQDEFIELYNPLSFPVNIKEYVLHTSSGSTVYQKVLPEIILQPGEFKALYSRETSLTLVNGKEGYAWLSAADGSIVDEIPAYPSTLSADKAWAYVGSGWQVTNRPTPGAANQLNIAESPEDLTIEELAACPEGKYRSPDTNRCRNLETIANALTPCRPGQERSLETNRCRAVASAKTAAPCQTGYERNPSTNRCRKVSNVAGANTTRSTKEDPSESHLNYILIVAGTVCLLGYGVYEYRQDLINILARLRKHPKKAA